MQIKVTFEKIVNVCASTIVISFFLPWINLLGIVSASGYDLTKVPEYGVRIWIIPLLSVVTIGLGYFKIKPHGAAAIAGIVPLLFVAYVLLFLTQNAGNNWDSMMLGIVRNSFSIGIYLTIAASAVMLIAAAANSTREEVAENSATRPPTATAEKEDVPNP